MIEIDDSIAMLGVFRRLLPFIPEDLQESFHAAAIKFSNGEDKSSSGILKRATKGLGLKEKLRILFLFGIWVAMVDMPMLVPASILAALLFFFLIFG